MEFEFIPDVFSGKTPEQIEDYLNSVAVDESLVSDILEWLEMQDVETDLEKKLLVFIKALGESYNLLAEGTALLPSGSEDC